MPVELPQDVDGFYALLRQRIRDQDAIDEHHKNAVREARGDVKQKNVLRPWVMQSSRHVIGQTGCFCLGCLVHRKQDWRIGDVNSAIVGPRDQWRQYTWGNAERSSLFTDASDPVTAPALTPSIKESIQIRSTKGKRLSIEREAKFMQVREVKRRRVDSSRVWEVPYTPTKRFVHQHSRGKVRVVQYDQDALHSSASVFACGDNSFGALGATVNQHEPFSSAPQKVERGISSVEGRVQIIAASGFASYALVGALTSLSMLFSVYASRYGSSSQFLRLCILYAVIPTASLDVKPKAAPEETKRMPARRQSVDLVGINRLRLGGGTNDMIAVNACEQSRRNLEVAFPSFSDLCGVMRCAFTVVFSWGRGDHGVLGHGDTESSSLPRVVPLFNAMRVVQVSAGLRHVLVLTELDGVFAFGEGVHGKLGVGTSSLCFCCRLVQLRGRHQH
ncbi:hypothetical protein PybrP1_011459 [[Pythium] brassicae (nom. inval.)]|nr:hypothetical protein PybrP1_011459 [[Pythium] brassicae (nom. inval.)]